MAERPLSNQLWYGLLKRTLRFILALGYSVRYSGRENIPSEGGVLVVSNHQSHLDPPLVGSGCPRRMNYLARQSLFRFGPFGWLIRSVNAIPIDRKGSGLAGIKETLRRLRRGEMVLIFPEGTRTFDGQVGPFRPGFTTLAVRGKAAILPVGIEGAFDAWPRSNRFPRLGVVHVHYGAPISPEEVKEYREDDLLAEVRNRVLQCQAELRRHPPLARRRSRGRAGSPVKKSR